MRKQKVVLQAESYLRRRNGVALALAIVLGTLWGSPARALPLVTFNWSTATSAVVAGTTQVSIDLVATQTGGADAAAITLGFSTTGIVTGVSWSAYGLAVSAPDSFFGDLGGVTGVIAVSPSSPGSFGIDVDFTVGTLLLALDTGLGSVGTLGLADLSSLAGLPALKLDGITSIPADLTALHTVNVVPEPGTVLLLGLGLVALGLRSAGAPSAA